MGKAKTEEKLMNTSVVDKMSTVNNLMNITTFIKIKNLPPYYEFSLVKAANNKRYESFNVWNELLNNINKEK